MERGLWAINFPFNKVKIAAKVTANISIKIPKHPSEEVLQIISIPTTAIAPKNNLYKKSYLL